MYHAKYKNFVCNLFSCAASAAGGQKVSPVLGRAQQQNMEMGGKREKLPCLNNNCDGPKGGEEETSGGGRGGTQFLLALAI